MKTSSNTERIIEQVKNGAVGVLLTDTVYGLVAAANDISAVTRLYGLKNREKKPGTLIAANIKQLIELGIDERNIEQVKKYWPGPISVILEMPDRYQYLHQGLGDLAVRVTGDDRLMNIIKMTGPLITTSANQPGEPTAQDISEAKEYFGNLVDFYLDDGRTTNQSPSTIVKIADGKIQVIRQGIGIIK